LWLVAQGRLKSEISGIVGQQCLVDATYTLNLVRALA
jgi:hypothetical protein